MMMNEHRSIFVVGCCGIPGVGKSSALKRFEKTGILQNFLDNHYNKKTGARKGPKIIYIRESSKEWREKGWLSAYYADQDNEAACFQFNVFDSHVRAVEAAIASAPPDRDLVLIQERTMYDQQLFWQQQVALGFKTANAHYDQAYQSIWNRWRRFVPEPNVLLLFETSDIQMTMRRVQARARAEELGGSFSESDGFLFDEELITQAGGLTTEYQLRLLQLHRLWFSEPTAHPPGSAKEGIPCVHINADAPYHQDDDHLRLLAHEIAGIVVEMFLK